MPRSAFSTAIVNSAVIADNSIVNADVNSAAAIAVSKLAAGTANQVLINSAAPTPAWTSLSGDITNVLGVTTIGNDKITTVKILDSNVTLAKIAPNAIDATVAKNLASADVIAGLLTVFTQDIVAGTTADIDITVTHKIRVIDVWLVKTSAAGGGAGSITVKSTASAITNALSIDIADEVIARAGTINDANATIAAGGILRFTRTRTASTDESCTVYVSAVRSA